MHSLDCQNFVHYNSLMFLPILGPLLVQGFIFERGTPIVKISLRIHFVCVCSARDWDRIRILEEIPRSGVQMSALT
jgi:hypothetical protein